MVPWGKVLLVAAALLGTLGPATAQPIPADLELILAVDVSHSVDAREAALQRRGYIAALADPRVLAAIQRGRHGRIAVSYVEWAGLGLQRVTVDRRVIAGAQDAAAFARALEDEPLRTGPGTSISSMFELAAAMFARHGIEAERRVLDVSGDGPNNRGHYINGARAALVAQGVTINGLAILTEDEIEIPDLDVYYQDCVVGGTGAFVVTAQGFEAFADAIVRKLIQEIADASAAHGALQPAQFLRPAYGPAMPQKYGPACDIGERLG